MPRSARAAAPTDFIASLESIGGIQFKLDGARQAGADYFFAPVENCPDVIGHIPAGLNVYAVNDLTDAYTAIVAIGKGKTDGLPTCDAVPDKSDK